MERKPANIIYGAGDTPPWTTSLMLAVQHALLALVFIIYPLILVTEADGNAAAAERVVTASILAMAAGTLLQALGWRQMGSGYLAVQINNPIYLSVSILAVHAGGLDLAFGMTMFAGMATLLFSRAIRYLRPFFPPEVCGVGVFMLGISMAGPGSARFSGFTETGTFDARVLAVASMTFGLMVALSVWPKGRLRLYSAIIGLCTGYAASIAFGLTSLSELAGIMDRGLLAVPRLPEHAPAFSAILAVPFLLTAMVSTLDSMAGLITCQKINHTAQIRPDMGNIGQGILADGCGTLCAGLFGTLGTGVSSAHIALTSATGATSRTIGIWTSATLLATAFIPPVAKLLARLPDPVVGAVMVYAAAFLITSGMELIVSRLLDVRRIFMVGCSVIVGLSSLRSGAHTTGLPEWAASIASSPFALASLCAVLLNSVFRIGTRQKASLCIGASTESIEQLLRFLEVQCATWGTRRQVLLQLQACATEVFELLILMHSATGPIDIEACSKEHRLELAIAYDGAPPPLEPGSPEPEELLSSEAAVSRLAGALVRQYADGVSIESRQGRQRIKLHFEP